MSNPETPADAADGEIQKWIAELQQIDIDLHDLRERRRLLKEAIAGHLAAVILRNRGDDHA